MRETGWFAVCRALDGSLVSRGFVTASGALEAVWAAQTRYGRDVGVMPVTAWLEYLRRGGALGHGTRMERATEAA